MIQRDILPELRKALRDIPVLTLTGPRQSGKTTLAKLLVKRGRYVNLEYPDERQRALDDPRGFLDDLGKNAVIDEVHHAPELVSYIQGRVDEEGRNGMYVLTGSHNLQLMERVTQSLAGRTYIHELLPLSAHELGRAGLLPVHTNDWLFKGGYPRLYDKQERTTAWLRSYLRTYVERDMRQVINVRDLNRFNRFLSLCAGRIGQLLNYTALATESGVDVKTAQHWISALEASYILFRLPPHHRNFNKRVVRTPKLFFHDTGLACALLGIRSAKALHVHHARGALFENMVITEVLKHRLNRGLSPDMFFWRDKTGREVDLLIDDPAEPVVIEVKAGRTVVADMLDGLRFHRSLAGDGARYLLVYDGDASGLRDGIEVRSWKDPTG